ncbi:MAG TPA: tripartite tricarboxylate transporter substrate-binding protein [Alphaproteobacteria bacterium]|nr:tripartite tricarboxylate transporter substrate-binding protein [Alphaproteobacteria bacterium]
MNDLLKVFRTVTAGALIGAALFATQAQAQESFYKGKTVTIRVHTGPGGSNDFYARAFGRYLPNHIPGAPTVVVQNMPGAGGKLLANHIFRIAPKDGTAIGSLNQTLGLDQLFSDGVEYDTGKFDWIARVVPTTGFVMVYHTAPTTTLEGMKTTELIFGAQGKGSQTYMTPIIMRTLLGLKTKAVLGYNSSPEIYLAMERGELHARTGAIETVLSSKPEWLADGTLKIIGELSLEKESSMPGVPLLTSLVKDDESRQIMELVASYTSLGISYAFPPDVPKDRLAAMRKAFMDTMKDPTFVAEMTKAKMDIKPASGEEMQALAGKFSGVSPELVEKTKKALEW